MDSRVRMIAQYVTITGCESKKLIMVFRSLVLSLCLVPISGCVKYDSDYKLPGVYRIDIQQGNVIEQEMLDKLRPGMDKQQVRFIMGTPAVEDPFHNNRWDYLYTMTEGASRRKQRHITLYFEEEKLAYIEGGVVPGLRKPSEEFKRQTRTVDVPQGRSKGSGFFGRILNAIPFVGDDEPAPVKGNEQKQTAEESGE